MTGMSHFEHRVLSQTDRPFGALPFSTVLTGRTNSWAVKFHSGAESCWVEPRTTRATIIKGQRSTLWWVDAEVYRRHKHESGFSSPMLHKPDSHTQNKKVNKHTTQAFVLTLVTMSSPAVLMSPPSMPSLKEWKLRWKKHSPLIDSKRSLDCGAWDFFPLDCM